jgi:hypothetical protein
MRNDYKWLEISDNLSELGEVVLDEEITLLAPYLMGRVLGSAEANDDGPNHKSSPLCKGFNGPTS